MSPHVLLSPLPSRRPAQSPHLAPVLLSAKALTNCPFQRRQRGLIVIQCLHVLRSGCSQGDLGVSQLNNIAHPSCIPSLSQNKILLGFLDGLFTNQDLLFSLADVQGTLAYFESNLLAQDLLFRFSAACLGSGFSDLSRGQNIIEERKGEYDPPLPEQPCILLLTLTGVERCSETMTSLGSPSCTHPVTSHNC